MKLSYKGEWHQYRIDGKLCRNISKLAEIPDDKDGLVRWFKRSVAAGIAEDFTIYTQAKEALGDDRAMARVAEKAITASRGGNDAAQRGTDMHQILEDFDLGKREPATPEERAAWDTYRKALAQAGITIDPELVERILVYPSDRFAGRMDRFVTVKRRKGAFVLDLKTGKVDYPHKFAVQLGLYANAHLMAGALDIRGETECFTQLPEMNLRDGYVVHMPTPYEANVLRIDIAAGYETFKKAVLPTLKWRALKPKDLLETLCSVVGTDPDAPASIEVNDMVKERLRRIMEHDETPGHPSGVNLTRARWPRAIPPRGPWSNKDIDALDQLLTNVERDASVPF